MAVFRVASSSLFLRSQCFLGVPNLPLEGQKRTFRARGVQIVIWPPPWLPLFLRTIRFLAFQNGALAEARCTW